MTTLRLPSVEQLPHPTGANFLCYVTPAEHLRLPDLDDVREGIIASKIAAHAADIANGLPGARDRDNEMSTARHKLDWDEMFRLALTPTRPAAIMSPHRPPSATPAPCAAKCAPFAPLT